MLRKKKIVIVSHCVLNQNSVVYPLSRANGSLKFVEYLADSGVGIIQLPCPELRYLGINRKPMSKAEYDTKEYRNLCAELFKPILDEIIIYINNGYSILGIIGINDSPTCSITGDRGVFMREILEMLDMKGINLNYFEVPSYYNDDTDYENVWVKLKQQFNIS